MTDLDQILVGLEEADATIVRDIASVFAKEKDPIKRAQRQWDAFLRSFPDEDDLIQKFFWIKTKDPDNPLTRIKFNSPQRRLNGLVNSILLQQKPVRVVILKARQVGFSTWIQAKLCYRVLTRPHFRAAVFAHDDAATQEIFDMTSRVIDHLPFAPPMEGRSVDEIRTALGAKYTTVTAGSRNEGHGMNAHWVHLSEMSRYPDASSTITGVMQTVGRKPSTAVFVETTANGMGGVGAPFYELWQQASSGNSDWVPFFVPWHENEDYQLPLTIEQAEKIASTMTEDEAWRQKRFNLSMNQVAWARSVLQTECAGSPERFKVQYPSYADEAFLHTGAPVFNIQKIQDLLKKVRLPIFRGNLVRSNSTPQETA